MRERSQTRKSLKFCVDLAVAAALSQDEYQLFMSIDQARLTGNRLAQIPFRRGDLIPLSFDSARHELMLVRLGGRIQECGERRSQSVVGPVACDSNRARKLQSKSVGFRRPAIRSELRFAVARSPDLKAHFDLRSIEAGDRCASTTGWPWPLPVMNRKKQSRKSGHEAIARRRDRGGCSGSCSDLGVVIAFR